MRDTKSSRRTSIFDFRAPYEWDEINEQVKTKLSSTGSVRVYQSVSSALLETTMGIQLLYSHKKQFHYAIGTGTHAEEALLFLAKQGIKSIEVSPATLVEIDDKKSLFLLNDIDDALTAQMYTPVATTAKVFNIYISHHQHNFFKPNLEPGESDIYIFSAPGMAIACLGKRAQSLHSFFSSGLSWSMMQPFQGFEKKQENAEWVKKVEKDQWAKGTPLLNVTDQRIYDRAILYWQGVDAGALRDILIKDFQVLPENLETLSLNRWHETRLVTQFEKRGRTPDILRGTLFMSTALASDDKFRKKLEQAIEHLRKISSF